MSLRTKVISINDFFTVIATETIERGEIIFPLAGNIVKQPSKYSIQINSAEHLLPYSNNPEDSSSIWRFMNHSCDPNTSFDIEKMVLVAIKNINPNEEVRFNYNTTEYEMASPFLCKCGSKNCYKEIKGFNYLSDIEKKDIKYLAAHLKKMLRSSVL